MEISSNLPMSTNIPDSRRSVLSVCVSPLGNLAAAVDCFGRVLLLDCETLIIRRMWKGNDLLVMCHKYFIESETRSNSKLYRTREHFKSLAFIYEGSVANFYVCHIKLLV